jgi:hypothetical protein
MKTLNTLSLAALMLVTASALSFAGESKKNTAQTQAATANQQLSIKLLRLRMRAHQAPTFTPLLNQ